MGSCRNVAHGVGPDAKDMLRGEGRELRVEAQSSEMQLHSLCYPGKGFNRQPAPWMDVSPN